MNDGQCTTVDLVLDAGAEGLLRVTSILGHQRTRVRSLKMAAHPELPGMQLLSLSVEASPDVTQQLVKRLRRALPVHRATATVFLGAAAWRGAMINVEAPPHAREAVLRTAAAMGAAGWEGKAE